MTEREKRVVLGSCHCGALRFEIRSDFAELTTCDCSICRHRNAVMVRVHESELTLLSSADALASRTARHYFCRVCGIYPFHRKRVTPDFYGVDVACLEGFDATGIPIRATAGAAMP